ncbi:MAG: GNAT family N-acetyltransferase [Myxococcales bacterium]
MRRFEPGDASRLAELVRKVWGTDYFHRELYDAEELLRLHAEGRHVSVVAADEAGNLVAHDALSRPELGSVGETCMAMERADHRGQGLMTQTRRYVIEIARELGLEGVYGQPVVTHTASQKVYMGFGFVCVGIGLGLRPSTLHSDQEEPMKGRGTLLLYYLPLKADWARPVFAPTRHREMLGRLYEALKLRAEFKTPAANDPGVEPAFTVKHGGFVLTLAGERTETRVEGWAGLEEYARTQRQEVLLMELPLDDARTPAWCESAERFGFSWSGLIPGLLGGRDALRLVRLDVPVVDGAGVHIADPAASAMFDYVRGLRMAVG